MPDHLTDANCVFCKIVAGALPSHKLYEDERTLAFMDINPLNTGHALVIAKHHYPDLYAAPDQVLAAVIAGARRVATAVRDALRPDGINLVQANGPGAAQSVPHLHVHVLPRRLDDEAKLNWGLKPGDRNAVALAADKIRAALKP
jgi:histidine triad (HIT) family protein